jgi:hypothetical protein
MSRRLDDLDLVALMIDGVRFGEHTCVVALGISSTGPSTRWRWRRARRDTTLVTGLVTGLRERGQCRKPILAC